MRTTYTYVTLEVSNAAFKEVIEKLRAAGYAHQFIERGNNVDIDMYGIALTTTCDHDWDCRPKASGTFFCSQCGVRLDT